MKSVSLEELYGTQSGQRVRYNTLIQGFANTFQTQPEMFFSAPGRSEIIGNHTDHNGGKVIAASINMDSIAAVKKREDSVVRIFSEGYDELIEIPLGFAGDSKYTQKFALKGTQMTAELIAGMIEAAQQFGFAAGGFDAYITSNVIPSAGVSSSASFEMLFCTIINFLFNDNQMNLTDCAKIGQYAENHNWNKASGLMDQMACASGGAILLDFADKDEIHYEQIPVTFEEYGYRIVLTNTGKGHADLSEEYSSVPLEMYQVAEQFGCKRLCEMNIDRLLEMIDVQNSLNDRAYLRAMHFFHENQRVEDFAKAVKEQDIVKMLSLLEASGNSSYKLLQNCYCAGSPKEQKIPFALALAEERLTDKGVCRVHGGGFAGVIMSIVPTQEAQQFAAYMNHYFGAGSSNVVDIRKEGAVQVVGIEIQ